MDIEYFTLDLIYKIINPTLNRLINFMFFYFLKNNYLISSNEISNKILFILCSILSKT